MDARGMYEILLLIHLLLLRITSSCSTRNTGYSSVVAKRKSGLAKHQSMSSIIFCVHVRNQYQKYEHQIGGVSCDRIVDSNEQLLWREFGVWFNERKADFLLRFYDKIYTLSCFWMTILGCFFTENLLFKYLSFFNISSRKSWRNHEHWTNTVFEVLLVLQWRSFHHFMTCFVN